MADSGLRSLRAEAGSEQPTAGIDQWVMATPIGFEPTISTVTGCKARSRPVGSGPTARSRGLCHMGILAPTSRLVPRGHTPYHRKWPQKGPSARADAGPCAFHAPFGAASPAESNQRWHPEHGDARVRRTEAESGSRDPASPLHKHRHDGTLMRKVYRSWFLGDFARGNHAAAPVLGESAWRTAAGVRWPWRSTSHFWS